MLVNKPRLASRIGLLNGKTITVSAIGWLTQKVKPTQRVSKKLRQTLAEQWPIEDSMSSESMRIKDIEGERMAKKNEPMKKDEAKTFMQNQERIRETCSEIEKLLLEKNAAYGDSVLSPMRVFSNASRDEQIKVRIDDKLSRLQSDLEPLDEEDVILDLIGYLILLRISQNHKE